MKKHPSRIHSALLFARHRFHANKKSLTSVATTALLFIALFGMVGTYIMDHGAKPGPYTAELSFADLSPRGEVGGQIVPASCESNVFEYGAYIEVGPPTTGFAAGSNATPYRVYLPNQPAPYRCFLNQGGGTYWVPMKTDAEFLSFWNAIVTRPATLPGLSIQ